MRKSFDNWKYYTDFRLYYYSGFYKNLSGKGLDFTFLRGYIKYFSSFGNFTFGKIYINFGNFSFLNPFEINKNVNFYDINYDKNGIIAIKYNRALFNQSGIDFYIAPNEPLNISSFGGDFYLNLNHLYSGIILNRMDKNNLITGVFFKTDLLFSIFGNLALHYDEHFNYQFTEFNGGLEHYFGSLFTQIIYYYNEDGFTNKNQYNFIYTNKYYFQARHYIYLGLNYQYDFFLSFNSYALINGIDYSGIYSFSTTITLNNGLNTTINFFFINGKNTDEFNPTLWSHFTLLLRLEAKF